MSNTRRAPRDTAETIELEPEPLSDAEQDALTIEENIAALFNADDKSVTWNCMVYELDKAAGNTEQYLFSVLPDELPALNDRLRDNNGTGVYRIRVYKKTGSQNRVFRQFDRRIKAPPKPVAAPTQQNDLSAILAAMERNNERMIQAITAASQRPPVTYAPPVSTNPFEGMQQMATAMAAIMQAFRPAEGRSSIDLIMKGVELASNLEKGDKETNMFDLIKEALSSLPAIVQMTEAQRTAQLPAPTKTQLPAPVKPAGTALPIVTPQPQPQPAMTPEMQTQTVIRNSVLSLIPKAVKGSDPALYAELIADDLGADMCMALIGQPDLQGQLQILVPEMVPYMPWFQSLLAELTELVNDARRAAPGSEDASGKPSPAVHSLRHTGWPGGGEGDTEDNE